MSTGLNFNHPPYAQRLPMFHPSPAAGTQQVVPSRPVRHAIPLQGFRPPPQQAVPQYPKFHQVQPQFVPSQYVTPAYAAPQPTPSEMAQAMPNQYEEEFSDAATDIDPDEEDLVESPSTSTRTVLKSLLILLCAGTVLAAGLVPALVLNFAVVSTATISTSTTPTTATTTTTFACIPSCVNGNCTAPNTCTCITGWHGSTCAVPNCTNPCQNGGNCSAPNTCTCATGWTGPTCMIPICNPNCSNGGNCIGPNTCNCTSSWNGSGCLTPVCNPACRNGGNCTAPNNCTCDSSMWAGSICQTPVRIFWSFDNTLQDLYNNFNGFGLNSPTYSSPGYNGAGACLLLNKANNQSVTINSPPFLNMAYTSFTLQGWMYAQTLCNGTGCVDNALFGQFEQNILDRSLHIIVRTGRIYLGFFADDASGNLTLNPGQWYHMSYVYDYATLTQFVYVDGYLDVSRSPAGPYQGTTGNLTIGTNGVNYPNNFFDGCLDSIAYFGRAKNATEVLYDATVVVHLRFDGNSILDSGPLQINGSGASYSFATVGRLNAALTLSGSLSYVQVTGLRRIGTDGWPYSVAIWIKPTSLAGGTIMHLSSRIDGAQPNGWCLPIMGLTASGQIAINSWSGINVTLTGPLVSTSTWTHVVATYSSTNGERLYVNNTLVASSSPYIFRAGGVPMTLTLASSLNGTGVCNTGAIRMGQYSGSLDEFHVFARELTASDISALYNV